MDEEKVNKFKTRLLEYIHFVTVEILPQILNGIKTYGRMFYCEKL